MTFDLNIPEPDASESAQSDDFRPDHVFDHPKPGTTERDLKLLLQQGEGTMLEYKESLSDSFARELVALANTRGGKVLLGVRDDGTITGAADSNNLRARIQDIARNCDPRVLVVAEPVGRVMVVHVQESANKPVQCREGFFARQGAVTQKLSRDELRELFQRENAVRFDTSFQPRFTYPEHFDFEKFEAWRELSGISAGASVEDVLINLGVAEPAKGSLLFRNAGVLFFARRARKFFDQAFTTCILFRGTERVHIVDRKDVEGGVVADIENCLRFIERNTRTAYRIESLKRRDIPEYPMTALREAIANAVMHRDWFMDGANVFVEIHADRIDIVSPGGLPGGLTPESLGQKSVRRNPLMADLLQRIGFIERAGTGIGRMRREARAHGSPEPMFATDAFFTVTFRPLRSMEFQHLIGREHDEAHDGAHDEAHGRRHSSHEAILEAPLTEAERSILVACREGAVTRQYLIQTGVFASRAGNFKRAISKLLAAKLVELTRPDTPRSRNQRYRATGKGRKVLHELQLPEG